MHVYNSIEKLSTILYLSLYSLGTCILQAPKICYARFEGTVWVF
jgi:hypothetical protein